MLAVHSRLLVKNCSLYIFCCLNSLLTVQLLLLVVHTLLQAVLLIVRPHLFIVLCTLSSLAWLLTLSPCCRPLIQPALFAIYFLAVRLLLLVVQTLLPLSNLTYLSSLPLQLLMLVTHTLCPLSTLTYLSSLQYLLSSFSACCPASPARCADSPAVVHPRRLVQPPLFPDLSLCSLSRFSCSLHILSDCCPHSHTCPAPTIS
jgi:hypothetical protein